MLTLLKKEINSFLNSLIGYIVISVFLTSIGLFMWVFPSSMGNFNVLDAGYANIDTLFIIAPWVFMFLVPAVTMRSFSEEKRTGTIELLLTRPLSDWQIIFAKYFAGFLLVIFSLLPTLVYYYTVQKLSQTAEKDSLANGFYLYLVLSILVICGIIYLLLHLIKAKTNLKSKSVLDLLQIVSFINKIVIIVTSILCSIIFLAYMPGNIDSGGTFGSYLGLLFLAAGFVAIGIFSSSVTDSQIIAFILAVFLSFFCYIGFESLSSLDLFGKIDSFILKLGINEHYISMSRGVIDTRDVIYFASLAGVFLLLTKTVLESRKW